MSFEHGYLYSYQGFFLVADIVQLTIFKNTCSLDFFFTQNTSFSFAWHMLNNSLIASTKVSHILSYFVPCQAKLCFSLYWRQPEVYSIIRNLWMVWYRMFQALIWRRSVVRQGSRPRNQPIVWQKSSMTVRIICKLHKCQNLKFSIILL